METRAVHGRFYAALCRKLRPQTVVEFGTAFEVSGMYWLAGLEEARTGHLHTFEINDAWADVAQDNLAAVGSRFTLHRGLFEECVEQALQGAAIDIAFVDGVHTPEWVLPQVELLAARLRPGGVIILDDINFSDDMDRCWRDLSVEPRVRSAAELMTRVGLLQL